MSDMPEKIIAGSARLAMESGEWVDSQKVRKREFAEYLGVTEYTRTDIAEAEITRLQQSAHKAIYLILEEGSAGEAAVVLIKAIANIGE